MADFWIHLYYKIKRKRKAKHCLVKVRKQITLFIFFFTLSCNIGSRTYITFFFSFSAVRNHRANSHAKKGWEQFTDAVIKAISDKKEGVVFLLWGNSAQEKSRYFHL